MTKAEAIKKWESGTPLLIVEYRGSDAAQINWRNKETGKPETMAKLSHNVELGNSAIVVTERVPDGFNPTQYTSPFKKGQMVLWHVDSMSKDKGTISGRGTIEALS